MKVRNGFVSNSSSSSFIVTDKANETKECVVNDENCMKNEPERKIHVCPLCEMTTIVVWANNNKCDISCPYCHEWKPKAKKIKRYVKYKLGKPLEQLTLYMNNRFDYSIRGGK